MPNIWLVKIYNMVHTVITYTEVSYILFWPPQKFRGWARKFCVWVWNFCTWIVNSLKKGERHKYPIPFFPYGHFCIHFPPTRKQVSLSPYIEGSPNLPSWFFVKPFERLGLESLWAIDLAFEHLVHLVAIDLYFFYYWSLAPIWLEVARELPTIVVEHLKVCIIFKKLMEPSSLNFVTRLRRG